MTSDRTPPSQTLDRSAPAALAPIPKRPVLDVSVSVKLTRAEKRALDRLAFDTDDTLARLIRSAIRKTYPNLTATNGQG